MTDKEKLTAIKAEIERLRLDWPKVISDGEKNHLWMYFRGLNRIRDFIDSLPEEPVSSVWHGMDDPPIKGEVIVVQTKDTFYGISVQKGGTTYKNRNKDRYVKWAYASDLLNLSNVQRIGKNWKEKPVSKDLEEASKDWLRPQLDKSYANYGEAKMMELTHFDGYSMLEAIEFGAQWKEEKFEKNSKEPVSEDLVAAANNYSKADSCLTEEEKIQRFLGYVSGAQWQKHHMDANRLAHCNSITNEQADLEQKFLDEHLDKYDRMPTYLDAIEYGIKLQRERILKAIDLGEPPYLISVEKAYYDVKKLLEG